MKGSIKLFQVFGIAIKVHITFIILPIIFFMWSGFKGLFVIISVFVLVTIHELCHSLMAKRFGVTVKEITLLPIGGVAQMGSIPETPHQEFKISIAGPMFNILLGAVLFMPLYNILGPDVLFSPSLESWGQSIAYIFWINMILAMFNLLPAFPMDGGRVLRSFLASRMDYLRATKIAVNLGHMFALLFFVFAIMHNHWLLMIIAVFIYVVSSNEETQVTLKETLKNFRVKDILARDFLTVLPDATLAKVLETVFHSHQEDFPVMERGRLVGFITRHDIVLSIHKFGTNKVIKNIMRKEFPSVKDTDSLAKIQKVMQDAEIRAVPVVRSGVVCGVISLEDISRVYAMLTSRLKGKE